MAPKNETVRLLVLNDSQDNTEQIINALKNAGSATRPQLVDTADALVESLKSNSWDILLAAEETDGISFDQAISLIRKDDKDLPVIVLTKEADPEIVVDAIQQGAADAVHQEQLQHLILVIKREFNNLLHRRARRRAEANLNEAEKRCELLLGNSRDAIAYVTDGMHIYVNQSYAELFGYQDTEDLEGMPIVDLVAKEHLNNFKDYLRSYSKGESISSDLRFRGVTAEGEQIDAMMQLSAASYDGEPCTQLIIRHDDGNAEELAEKLREVVLQDALTGLPNRQSFEDSLTQAVNKARKEKVRTALFYLAIDNISHISASAGIAGTDSAVQEVSRLLMKHYGESDLSRFGDSSFAALIPQLDTEQAVELAEKVRSEVHSHLIEISDGRTVQTSLSIGVVLIGETAEDPADMLSRAINASEKVRINNGNGVSLYSAAENASDSDSALHELVADALDNNKFKLVFQPLIDISDDSNEFFEVFVRLPIGDDKFLSADDFLPVIAKQQLGTKLDRWVLLTAAKMLKDHLVKSPNARMLVNLTAESLQDDSMPAWAGKLAKAVAPQGAHIVLQFGAADIVNYLKLAKDQTAAFVRNGCPVSISHFGCTLNPLNTLGHVSTSFIKLDRSFTEDLSNEENLGAIKQISSELLALDKQVIVSYVENAQTLSKLWTLGAQYLQGYYLQPPSDRLQYDSHQ